MSRNYMQRETARISDGRPSIFQRAASWMSNVWESITTSTTGDRPTDTSAPPRRPPPHPPPLGTILETQDVTIDINGGVHNLSSFGVLLEIPPNAVTHSTKIVCHKFSPDGPFSPTEENETLVSYCVGIWPKEFVPRLQKPITVTLNHSGPSKKEGYETIVKARKPGRENQWKRIKEIREDSPLARQHFKSGYIEVEISEWTALAVVTRLITDTFEVTDKGCFVRSSVCDDVTVEFHEGAVDRKYDGSMKLLLMPDYIEILDGIDAHPCPLILIYGFEGVTFKIPVKIRLPHPYPAGYPSGNVRLLTMDAPHEWKDITDQVHCVKNESFIELEVNHFSGFLVYISSKGSLFLEEVSSLYWYLRKVPRDVCFAVFKETEVYSDVSLTMTLVCVPNHEQNKVDAMEILGYRQLSLSTGNKPMRPGDKAYTKVEGSYEKKIEEDIFLQFIENEICRKELPLRRKSNASRGLFISFLEKKDGDVNDNLCKFYIDESKLSQEKHRFSELSHVQRVKTVGLENAPGPSGLCGSEIVKPPRSRKSTSEDASYKDLEVCFGDKSIATIDTNEAASKVKNYLNLDKHKLDDPPDDIVAKCRELCSYLKSNGRDDIVKKIRDLLPSGMTGPLGDGSVLVKNMDYNLKRRISRALSATDEWKSFAEEVGVSKDDIAYYDEREKNPVLVILEEHCGDMTIEELYVHIVESGANAIADNHL